MAKTTKPIRIIRPNSKKTLRETTPIPAPKGKAEVFEKVAEVKSEEPAPQGGGENAWSGWLWSDEGSFYYRARKDAKNVWQYEYTSESTPTTPVAEQKAESPRYVKTSIEYPSDERKVVYVTETTYTYGVSSSGGSIYMTMPVCEDMSTTAPAPAEESTGQKGVSQKAEPVKANVSKVEVVPDDEEEEEEVVEEDVKEDTKVGVERVDEWRRHVNDALQEGEKSYSRKIKTQPEHDGKVRKREGHSKKRDEKHREHRERRR